ncbi:MAG: 3D domain-containing protein [Clostridiaceae bacterium]
MNKKLISGFLSLFLLLGQATQVAANTVQEELNQNKSYQEELESKISQQEEKIFGLNDEINVLYKEVDSNNRQISQLEENIKGTELEIESTKKRIMETQKLYDNKMRQLYKNGGQADYLSILLDADSIGDFLSRVNTLTKLISMDSQIITDFRGQSTRLETLLTELDNKKTEAELLKEDNEKKLASLENSRQEQSSYVEGLEKELLELNKIIASQENKLAEEARIAEAERKAEEERRARESKQVNNPSQGASRGGYVDNHDHSNKRSLGIFKLTAYCPCSICTGNYANGITSTGTRATANRTIAVDPRVIPYGAKVEINGNNYVAEDTGSAIKQYKIDIFFNTHSEALRFGVKYSEVFIYQ